MNKEQKQQCAGVEHLCEEQIYRYPFMLMKSI